MHGARIRADHRRSSPHEREKTCHVSICDLWSQVFEIKPLLPFIAGIGTCFLWSHRQILTVINLFWYWSTFKSRWSAAQLGPLWPGNRKLIGGAAGSRLADMTSRADLYVTRRLKAWMTCTRGAIVSRAPQGMPYYCAVSTGRGFLPLPLAGRNNGRPL